MSLLWSAVVFGPSLSLFIQVDSKPAFCRHRFHLRLLFEGSFRFAFILVLLIYLILLYLLIPFEIDISTRRKKRRIVLVVDVSPCNSFLCLLGPVFWIVNFLRFVQLHVQVLLFIFKAPQNQVFEILPLYELVKFDIDLIKPIDFDTFSFQIRDQIVPEPSDHFYQLTHILISHLTFKMLLLAIVYVRALKEIQKSLLVTIAFIQFHYKWFQNQLNREVFVRLFIEILFFSMLQYTALYIKHIVFPL